jgi:hypothetical protein
MARTLCSAGDRRLAQQIGIGIIPGGPDAAEVLIPGFQGSQGEKGDQGVGIQGPEGPVGPQGANGTNFKMFDVDANNVVILPTTGIVGEAGYAQKIDKFYICLNEGPPATWMETGTISGIVNNIWNPLIHQAGPRVDRSLWDDQPAGFPYLTTDTQLVYVREGPPGNWGPGIPFRGPKGDDGADGVDGSDALAYMQPTAPAVKKLSFWWKSDEGQLFVGFQDADSLQWVAVGGAPGRDGRDGQDADPNVYVPLAGGVMTGPLVLPGVPAQPLEAATKGYVDARSVENSGNGWMIFQRPDGTRLQVCFGLAGPTNASGQIVINWPRAFSGIPRVTCSPSNADWTTAALATSCMAINPNPTSCGFQAWLMQASIVSQWVGAQISYWVVGTPS